MTLIEAIDTIIKEQQLNKKKFIPVDLILKNGNILLRSFRIYEIDFNDKTLKGLTFQEEYIHMRERRSPEYCILSLTEIKALYCPFLEINFSQNQHSNLFEKN